MKREYWRYLPAVFPYLKRFKGLFLLSILLMIAGAVAGLADPWPLALLVDNVLGNHRPPQIITHLVGTDQTHLILFAVGAGFIVAFVIHGIGVFSEYVNTKIDQSVALDVRSDLFAHCQRLSQAFHEELTTGDFMYRINFEATQYGSMSVALLPFVQSILTLVGMFVIALTIDPPLALISLAVVPFVYLSIGFYGKRIEPRLIFVRNLETVSLTMVNTAMAMLRVITAFNREDHEHRRFRRQGEVAVRARVRLTVYQTLFSLAVALITAAGVGLVLLIGARDVLAHRLSVGQLLVVMYYIHAMYQPLQTISATMSSFQERLISIKYARKLFETQPDIVESPDALPMERAAGRVTFEHVDFDYKGRSGTLRDISFDIEPGKVVAVIGVTGAGKSTLVSMIPRFIDPKGGRVLIDGVDIRDLTLDSLREQVGFVQQEPLLFPESILENIRYGRLDASVEEVMEAARAANVHDFITQLPAGYDTVLGERGAKISGGERQRIAIARAFLKNAPILILDEPTSSIDSRTEAVILDALDRLMAGRTTFIVAHRLSTVRTADWILVLDDGRLIEQGSPADLAGGEGLYSLLHSLQAGVQLDAARPAQNGHEPDGQAFAGTVTDAPVAPALTGRGKVVVLGMMTKMPVSGVVWQTVHYLVGLQRLGFEVYYVEAHARTPSMLMRNDDDDGSALAARFIADVMRRFGFDGRWCFQALHADGRCYGMSEAALRDLYRDAALIVNLHGGTEPRPEHSATGRLVYLETDPVQLQVELYEQRQETIDFLSPHVAFFTFGENWGRPGCRLPPNDRFTFLPTRQPVVLDLWDPGDQGPGTVLTTIGNWRQAWRSVTLDGQRYHWSKHLEFLKFLTLPQRTGQDFELSLASIPEGEAEMLRERGWRVQDPAPLSENPSLYRRYILGSRGEFTVAKDQNVRLRTGWFSDRSATYLAAGRPVITQDTGFGDIIPTGRGLFSFLTVDEAVAAVDEVSRAPIAHGRWAAELAREHFDSDIVLTKLVEAVGLATGGAGSTAAKPPAQMAAATCDVTATDAPLPLDLVIEPISRRPIVLDEQTVTRVIGRDIPAPGAASSAAGDREPRASLVVVTFDNLVFTRMCLESLLWSVRDATVEVIVVDNGSTDGTPAYLEQLAGVDRRVRVLRHDANLGFARAANIGLREARGDLLVILNNDVILPQRWLETLSAHLDDPGVGMVAPLTNRGGTAGVRVPEYRTYGELLAVMNQPRLHGARRDVDMLPMFCVALRRQVFDEIGPLDERFAIGMFEDDDYAMRLHQAGFRLVCAEDVFVHHFGEASLGKLVRSGAYSRLFDANRRLFEQKWNVVWARSGQGDDPEYLELKSRLRDLVGSSVPRGASVLVLSKGDEELVALEGVHAAHFPQSDDGAYAGWYPADGAAAVAQLERLHERGFEYVVVPFTSQWWLDHYAELRRHLVESWGVLAEADDVAIVYGPRSDLEEVRLAGQSTAAPPAANRSMRTR